MTAALARSRLPLPELHARFAAALPAVEGRARRAFGRLRCSHARADATAEAVAAAWEAFLRAVVEYRPLDPMALARAAVAAARRRLRPAVAAGLG